MPRGGASTSSDGGTPFGEPSHFFSHLPGCARSSVAAAHMSSGPMPRHAAPRRDMMC